ncbi:hypothetical protein HDF26_002758 [Pedobacter cryoconitis]|uniref:hypothetical protein n=1 Tax=Pedobacter cryoconitis TaxID=188932 RepID=UPI001620561F|nr:hypothetical protein [Pedobacter cryoconitis]MBB6272301.1 hypothetical protein [Pedobacter cryoconitis]
MINKFKSISWVGLGLICVFGLNVTLILAALLLDYLLLDILAFLVSVFQLFLYQKLNPEKRKFKIHSKILNLKKSHSAN